MSFSTIDAFEISKFTFFYQQIQFMQNYLATRSIGNNQSKYVEKMILFAHKKQSVKLLLMLVCSANN